MRLLSSALSLFLPSALLATALVTLPGAYIVELDGDGLDLTRRSTAHSDFYASLDASGVQWMLRTEFSDPDIFVGASVAIENPEDYGILSRASRVTAIYPVKLYPRPEPVFVRPAAGPDGPALGDAETTHEMTGVNKLHAEGYLGRNITIGIIDTGTDYTNPWLGGCFGSGCKVAFGYDLVGDNYNGTNLPVPDPDPLDQCQGHGTHVAGIIAANPGNAYGISGVAYEATLASYRVFGCPAGGTAGNDVIINALMMAYNASCDVITLSLGGVQGWTEGPLGVVASRIAAKGTILTIAAGNDGQYGGWYASDPGDGLNVISVASVDNTIIPVQNLTVSNGYGPVPYYNATPLAVPGSHMIYATSTNTSITDDACSPLPDDTPDLSDYVVLIKRGTCEFVEKLANAAAKGGQYFLIYDNVVESLIGVALGNYTATLISNADGIYLVDQFASGSRMNVSFPQLPYNLPNNLTGGLVSSYSSYGPTYDLYFKPAVAAPGGNILSTYPVPLGTFAVLSGTSMATPFVAGSSALLLQAYGKELVNSVFARTRFETTASTIPVTLNDSTLQTAAVQGAGLINVYNAMHYSTFLTPGELLLNDTDKFVADHIITITNAGSKVQKYTVAHLPAGTAPTYNDSFPLDGPLVLGGPKASVWISTPQLVLLPGASTKVALRFTPPVGLDPTTFPVYSGFIQVSSDAGETLHASYLGVAASVKDAAILDNTSEYFGYQIPALVDQNSNVINYTDGTPEYFNLSFVDQPTLLFRLLFGTPAIRVDLVSASENLSKRDERSYRYPVSRRQVAGGGSFGQVPIIGTLVELDYQPRSSDATDYADNGFDMLQWNGTFANGSLVDDGDYKILLRALKIRGDPSNESDYEKWLSPIIGVNWGAMD